MTKFIEWRNNERKRRTSEDRSPSPNADDTNNSNTRNNGAADSSSLADDDANVSERSVTPIDDLLVSSQTDLRDLVSQQQQFEYNQYMNIQQISRAQLNTDSNIPRHSLPSNMSKNYISKAYKRKKTKGSSNRVDPNTIHEDEVKEFEGYHCHNGFGEQSADVISPPMKFYKQNSNPYPMFGNENSNTVDLGMDTMRGNNGSAGVGGAGGASTSGVPLRPSRSLQNCPVKPKRLLLKQQNMQKNTKELSDAHFNGAYQNYEVHSPYYEGKGRDFAAAVASELNKNSANGKNSEGTGRYSPQYQAIINKHGDVVEYAIPYCEQRKRDTLAEFVQQQQQIAADDEEFQVDLEKCETIINQNFCFLNAEKMYEATGEPANRSSLYNKRPRKLNEQILITDLDKSLDSSKTLDTKRQSHDIFDELNSLSKWSENLSKCAEASKSQKDLLELFDAVKASMPCCRLKELRSKVTVLHNTFASPVEIVSGTFRKTKVTLRNYLVADAQARDESMMIAAEAIKRDFEILR